MDAPHTHPLAPIWPPARLRITTPRVELRIPTEQETVDLIAVANEGIHDPAQMPFAMPWTDEDPETLARSAIAFHAGTRANLTADSWAMPFAVFVDGEPAGTQDIGARRFSVRREVTTGSWLGQRFHGRGLGTEMREAVLHFAFEGLGALAANSGAYEDNVSSQRVSEKAGYVRNGIRIVERSRGPRAPGGESHERAVEIVYLIDRATWTERRRDDITIAGLDDDLLEMLGAKVSVGD
jgi:RimJ/RimL family protein N-acetyltransferase